VPDADTDTTAKLHECLTRLVMNGKINRYRSFVRPEALEG